MKNNKTLLLLIPLLLSAIISFSQTEVKDPIDIAYENCLSKDTSIANIGNCTFQAYGKWDKELKKYYNRLLKEIKKDKDKTAFVQSQKAWLAWRDAEFHSYDNMFNKPGGKWTKIRADNRITIVKERVRQLKEYYDSFTKK